MKAIVLQILLSLPAHVSDRDEPPDDRRARLALIADDILDAARSVDEMAALITVGEFESHYARWVGAGCIGKPPARVGHCDHGRSQSYWQIKRAACPEGHKLEKGSHAAQRVFARCGVKLLRGSLMRCQTVEGMFSSYATGGRCAGLKDATQRANEYRRVLGLLQGKLERSGVQ